MNEPDIALLEVEVLGIVVLGIAPGAVVEGFEVPDGLAGVAGAWAKAGAANIVATRQAAICVLSICELLLDKLSGSLQCSCTCCHNGECFRSFRNDQQ
jgi:hypothetical protein